MAEPPIFVNLLEKQEELTDKKTKKAEQKSITKSDYIPPPGHISLVRQGVTEEDELKKAHLIFHNGSCPSCTCLQSDHSRSLKGRS